MPTLLPIPVQNALVQSLGKYTGALGQDFVGQATQKILDGLTSILNPQQQDRGGDFTVTVGETPASIRGQIAELTKRFANPAAVADELKLDFKIQVATEVAQGAGRHITDNYDQAELDQWPALELLRVYSREIPRGEENSSRIREDNDWPSRWTFAATQAGDTDAARILQDTGRMIALKASPIWQALGDGAGGYDDTLGNPFPPFAFNSGMDVDGVSRQDCIDLGLLREGDNVQGAEIDFANLFGLEAAA